MRFSSLSKHPRRGASLLDYGLIGVLVAVLAIGAVTAIGDEAGNPFADMDSGFSGVGSAGGSTPSDAPEPTPAPLVNLANSSAGATVSAIDIYSSYVAANAFDGDDGTQSVTSTHIDDSPWFRVDFPGPTAISAFRVLQVNGDQGHAETVTLQSSNDLSTWSTQHVWSGDYTDPDTGLLTLAGGPVTATYWRIVAGGDSLGWQVFSFELLGDEGVGTLPGINVATPELGAVASAINTYSSYVPSRIIDGLEGTYACTLDPVSGRWYKVDLGAARTITYFRASQAGGPLDQASAYVIESSNDNSVWTVRHTYASAAPVDSGAVELSGGPITARYWRIRATAGGSHGWLLRSFELRES